MFFDLELALVVKQTSSTKAAVGALNRQAVEGGVVIGHEGVKLQGEVAESGAVDLLTEKRCQALAAVLPSPQREEVSRSAIAFTNSANAA